MENGQHTDDTGELARLTALRESYSERSTSDRTLGLLIKNLDDRIAQQRDPADEESRLLADKTPATRGFVRRNFRAYLQMIAKEIAGFTWGAVEPLKQELMALQKRVDELERKEAS